MDIKKIQKNNCLTKKGLTAIPPTDKSVGFLAVNVMNTRETYVSLETAKLLKQAGFDWGSSDYYYDCSGEGEYRFYDMQSHHIIDWNHWPSREKNISAPTLSVTQKWLREVKGMHIYVKPCDIYNEQIESWSSRLFYKGNDIIVQGGAFGSYEDALEAGIKKCLEIILEEE